MGHQGIQFLQNQAGSFNVFMASTANPLEGLGGLTLSVQVAKGAGAYATATPTSVFDRGSGSYSVVMPSTAFDTAGVLEIRFTGTGAVATHVYGTVVAERAATVSGVWAHGTRTMTGFGTLAADVATAVWAHTTRELTGFGTLIAGIWNHVTRTLTSGGGGLTTEQHNALMRADANVAQLASTIVAAAPRQGEAAALAVRRGFDYHALDGRAFTITSDGWPNLTGAVVSLVKRDAARTQVAAMSAPQVGIGQQTVQLELTAAQTTAMAVGVEPLRVSVELANGRMADLLDLMLLVE